MGLISFAQNNTNSNLFKSVSKLVYKPIVFHTNINNWLSNSHFISIYNPNTRLLSTYNNLDSKYELNSISLHPQFISKIDSLNPNGAGNFGSALVIGTIKFLIEKL